LLTLGYASTACLRPYIPERRAEQARHRAIQDVYRTAPTNALIMVEDMKRPHSGGLALNPLGLASDPLLMRDPEEDWPVVARVFPDRQLFRMRARRPHELIPLSATGLVSITKHAYSFPKTIGANLARGASNEHWRVASPRDGEGWLLFGGSFYLPRGHFHFELIGEIEEVTRQQPITAQLMMDQAQTASTCHALWGTTNGLLLSIPVEITNGYDRTVPFIRYHGSGDVRLRSLRMVERDAP
jgi:hypothetical protein